LKTPKFEMAAQVGGLAPADFNWIHGFASCARGGNKAMGKALKGLYKKLRTGAF
jgi:hypothetical protein